MIEYFPDGTKIDEWFYEINEPKLEDFENRFVLTDYGILPDGKLHTEQIQALIDKAYNSGGGLIVVPSGEFLTGALFFKQGVNLYLNDNAVLKGSDDISDYRLMETRIEGESCLYFSALINVDKCDNFCLFGNGTLDGNGLRSWKAFWLREKWNHNLSNKDEQRPRLLYVSNSSNVTVFGVKLQNSCFWTSHFYKCNHVKVVGCDFFAPKAPVRAPSSDGVDIDVCSDFLVKNCRIEVNDDAVVLKGGKGTNADKLPENGRNERIVFEDSEVVNSHACITCGSESICDKNIVVRRLRVNGTWRMFLLKMRLDTPQLFENIRIENISGDVGEFFRVMLWSQTAVGCEPIKSYAQNITIQNCRIDCEKGFCVDESGGLFVLKNIALGDNVINAKECLKLVI